MTEAVFSTETFSLVILSSILPTISFWVEQLQSDADGIGKLHVVVYVWGCVFNSLDKILRRIWFELGAPQAGYIG